MCLEQTLFTLRTQMATITYKVLSIEKGGFSYNTGMYLKVEKTIKRWFREPVVEIHIVFGNGVKYYGCFCDWYYVDTANHLQLDDYSALLKAVQELLRKSEKDARLSTFKTSGF